MLQDIKQISSKMFSMALKKPEFNRSSYDKCIDPKRHQKRTPGDFSLLAPINDLCFNINLFYARAQKSLSSVISLVTESSQTKITEGCFHSRPMKNNANKIPPNSFHRNFAKISDGKVKVNWLFFLSVDFQGWCLIRRLENLWELL